MVRVEGRREVGEDKKVGEREEEVRNVKKETIRVEERE